MFHEAVRVICASAGWKEPRIADEACSFHLEDGLSFALSSPDGVRLMARAVLASPRADQEIAPDLLESVLRLTPARFARLRAVPFLEAESGALALYAFAPLDAPDENTLRFAERFLNDLAFWKAQPFLTTLPPDGGGFRWQ